MARRRPSVGGINRSIRNQARHLLTTGRRFERFDQIRQRHFWSACIFTANANDYISGSQNLFITPAGQNGQGFPSGVALSDTDTNWKSSNRVPDNQNFEITEIGVGVLIDQPGGNEESPTGKVVADFLDNAVVSITYLTNSVPLGLAADFAQASAPYGGTFVGVNNNTTGDDQIISSNGFAAPALRRRFKIPILLQHGETFSFELRLPRAVNIGSAFSTIYARLDFWATESFAEKS